MADWLKGMQQTFEYYVVDPSTWKDTRLITTVTACSITRDASAETLGSASFDINEALGECYIRAYLVTVQDGVRERHPLGTYLVQTPSTKFNGKVRKVSMEAYTPLLELKEKPVPLGYAVGKGQNIMQLACDLTAENLRAPVVEASGDATVFTDFVANSDDTWLTFLSDFMANAKYKYDLDEMGRVLFAPDQELEALQPVWTYTDDNSSILYSDVTTEYDLYGIPNVVEVIYSGAAGTMVARATNDDPNSPVSTVARGREIMQRETQPKLSGKVEQTEVEQYAKDLLRDLSTVNYTVTYSHGYCPARVGDCVRINYSRAGLENVKAKVISQTIKCTSGCKVEEKAVFARKLWG